LNRSSSDQVNFEKLIIILKFYSNHRIKQRSKKKQEKNNPSCSDQKKLV